MTELIPNLLAALSITLLHFLWQGLLIGALALLLMRTLQNARPQARYALTYAALVACLLSFAITLILTLTDAMSVTLLPLGERFIQQQNGQQALSSAARTNVTGHWLVALWAVGSGIMFIRIALGLRVVKRMRHYPPAPRAWQIRLDELAERMGLQPVILLVSEQLGSPLSAGFLRPLVLVPIGLLTRLPCAQIEALLAHELAHIRRHDYVLNLIQVAIEALLFYHPVVWWLARHIRLEREHIADALAVEATGKPKQLALALAALAELPTLTGMELVQAGSGGVLKARIERLFLPMPRVWTAGSKALILMGLSISLLGLLACSHIASNKPERIEQSAQVSVKSFAKAKQADRLSYALVRRDVTPILAWGPDDELDQVARALPRHVSDFVLVRRNGRDAVLTDGATVASLRQDWERAESLEHQSNALDSALMKKYAGIEPLRSNIESGTTSDAMLAEWQKRASELDQTVSVSKQIDRDKHRAYQRVEQQLQDIIAAAPAVAL